MESIKNSKDPTGKWSGYSQALLLTLGVLALGVSGVAPAAAEGERLRRDLTRLDGVKQNLTCIAHDTKFTCDCQNVNQHMQLPHLIGYVFQIEIRNCKYLSVVANTLEMTQGLRKITFKNVDNLVLERYALAFPRYASNTPLIVEFEKVNFEIINSHAISGNIEEMSFIGGRIDVIHPFGFTTLKDRAILLKIDNVLVKKIEPQAFKKFAVEQIEITNCIFDSNVPSKAFYELEALNTLRIDNVRFKEVHSHAFSFKMISKLSITNNYFDAVDAEWLEAHVRDTVTIRENHFGTTSQISFKGISVHRDYLSSERLELRFTNNTVHFANEPRPLEFNERFALNLKQLQYENTFACKDLDMTQEPPQPKNEFYRKHADNIYFQRDGTNNNNQRNQQQLQNFAVLSKIIEWDCQEPSYLLYILLGVLALVLLILVILVVVCVLLAKRRKKRKMDVVLPEPRTYKETQIIYQIENAGLLKTDL